MAKLLYQGHGSFRITSAGGAVAYIDPFAGGGYDVPADLVLVTHQHGDHNRLELVTRKPGCTVISNKEALAGGRYNSFTEGDFAVEAVEAYNQNHDPRECVGYIVTVDGVTVYASGDTSKTKQMGGLAARGLDYALFPCDGVYNMNPAGAAECARLVGAKHNIPIHLKPGALFDKAAAESFDAPNRVIVEPGREIDL